MKNQTEQSSCDNRPKIRINTDTFVDQSDEDLQLAFTSILEPFHQYFKLSANGYVDYEGTQQNRVIANLDIYVVASNQILWDKFVALIVATAEALEKHWRHPKGPWIIFHVADKSDKLDSFVYDVFIWANLERVSLIPDTLESLQRYIQKNEKEMRMWQKQRWLHYCAENNSWTPSKP